jgi:hypothetical protein
VGADDAAPRTGRDESGANVRARLIGLRDTLTGLYGPAILAEYGLNAETPTAPDLLLQRAASVEKLLRKRPIIETPRQPGVTLDLTALANAVKADAGRLQEKLGDVEREEREAQLTLTVKQEATAKWSTAYQGVADTITGLYEIAGRADLADRVRPTARRRAGLPEPPDEPGSPETPNKPQSPETPVTPDQPPTPE